MAGSWGGSIWAVGEIGNTTLVTCHGGVMGWEHLGCRGDWEHHSSNMSLCVSIRAVGEIGNTTLMPCHGGVMGWELIIWGEIIHLHNMWPVGGT